MLLYTKFSFKLPVYSTSCKKYIAPYIHYLFQHTKTNNLKTIKNICTICVYLFLTVSFRFNGLYSSLCTVWTTYLSTKKSLSQSQSTLTYQKNKSLFFSTRNQIILFQIFTSTDTSIVKTRPICFNCVACFNKQMLCIRKVEKCARK